MNFENKVYLGENHPLVKKTNKVPFQHDYGIEFPNTTKTYESENGIDWMYKTIKNYKEKVALFLLGPLTNFAKVYQRDNTIVNNIKEISIMGGAKDEGNMGKDKITEWNVVCDAEAANIVFNCGIKIKVIGQEVKMDYDNDIYDSYNIYQKLLDINTRSSLFAYYSGKGTLKVWNNSYVYDPITVLYQLDNKIIEFKDYYTIVNTTNPNVNGTDYGTMYFFETNSSNKANIQYRENFNLTRCYEVFFYYLKNY